jgi:hypothetical protein
MHGILESTVGSLRSLPKPIMGRAMASGHPKRGSALRG